MEHTPWTFDGVWAEDDIWFEGGYWTLDLPTDDVKCYVRDHAGAEKTLTLIVAVLDLLEACEAAKAIIGEPGDYDGLQWDEAEHLLQSAIAKAKGGDGAHARRVSDE